MQFTPLMFEDLIPDVYWIAPCLRAHLSGADGVERAPLGAQE